MFDFNLKVTRTGPYAPVQGGDPEMLGFVITAVIDLFDKRYDAFTVVAATTTTIVVVATGLQGRGVIQYQDFSDTKVAVSWEYFKEMFRIEYVSLVDRVRLAHEYLSLK